MSKRVHSIEIRDPIYGDILLEPHEAKLVNTFEMQRLSRIKQLGFIYLFYPGATHTRLEHSLGTLHIAQRIVTDSNLSLNKPDIKILRTCALIHDIGHTPFSHICDNIRDLLPDSHEEVCRDIISGEMPIFGPQPKIGKRISHVISTEYTKEENDRIMNVFEPDMNDVVENNILIRKFIDGDVLDCDSLDWIYRDAWHLGLPAAFYDKKIFQAFTIGEVNGEKEICIEKDAPMLDSLFSVLEARARLYRFAYWHSSYLIVDAMFIKAFVKWIETLRYPKEIYSLDDNSLLQRMRMDLSDNSEVKKNEGKLLHMILCRDLYKRTFILKRLQDNQFNEDVDNERVNRIIDTLNEEYIVTKIIKNIDDLKLKREMKQKRAAVKADIVIANALTRIKATRYDFPEKIWTVDTFGHTSLLKNIINEEKNAYIKAQVEGLEGVLRALPVMVIACSNANKIPDFPNKVWDASKDITGEEGIFNLKDKQLENEFIENGEEWNRTTCCE